MNGWYTPTPLREWTGTYQGIGRRDEASYAELRRALTMLDELLHKALIAVGRLNEDLRLA